MVYHKQFIEGSECWQNITFCPNCEHRRGFYTVRQHIVLYFQCNITQTYIILLTSTKLKILSTSLLVPHKVGGKDRKMTIKPYIFNPGEAITQNIVQYCQ